MTAVGERSILDQRRIEFDEGPPLMVEAPELIVVANRLPVVAVSPRGWRIADGGLVQAIGGALGDRRAAWIGWDAGDGAPPARLTGLDCSLHAVHLDVTIASAFYNGFANRTLWPALHDVVSLMAIDPQWWHAYHNANILFADRVLRLWRTHASRDGDRPIVWIHDYHLMLLPRMLRRRGFRGPSAFFLHTPFPPPAVFGQVPWRAQLLAGMLGADLVGFQTALDRDNFEQACDRFLPLSPRAVQLAVHPASIAASDLTRELATPAVQSALTMLRHRLQGRRLVLGVDRLDYTKGILERVRAVAQVASRRPDLFRNTVVVQAAVPTRQAVPEYHRFARAVRSAVEDANQAYRSRGLGNLIEYHCGHLDRAELLAHYMAAEAALVTPLRDGMNLVAKEYVTAQAACDGDGALLLSRHAGAAAELPEAVQCDPFDPDDLASSLERALDLPRWERQRRMAAMGSRVMRRDARQWAAELLHDLETSHARARRAFAGLPRGWADPAA